MFGIICRPMLTVSPKLSISVSPQFLANGISVSPQFLATFSCKQSSSCVNGDDPIRSFTISYLINSCGLSSKDALSISNKVTIKSPERSDSVLELFRQYGFTNENIAKLITRWPNVLLSCPKKTLLPKLEFLRSIGVPLDDLAQVLSSYPLILHRSLENYLIPLYYFLKTLVQSDERIVNVFKRAPRVFAHGWQREVSFNIALLRERGLPESCIVWLMDHHPAALLNSKEKFASCIDRATELGLDRSKFVFVNAIQVLAYMSESNLKHKMEVYKRCGWSESDISLAFRKNPACMRLSEKKITDSMDFLVNGLGLQPNAVARYPVLLSYNVDRRMKPRYLVARVLNEKGLLKEKINASTFLIMPEEKFLQRYIVNYQKEVPELLDIYRGKLSVSEMEFSQEVIFK